MNLSTWESSLISVCQKHQLTEDTINGLISEINKNLFPGATSRDEQNAVLITLRSRIERDNIFDAVVSDVLLGQLIDDVKQTLSLSPDASMGEIFLTGLSFALSKDLIARKELILRFDLQSLANEIERSDITLGYLGLQTLYDRYFIHYNEKRIELPLTFLMRVAMGLAIEEKDPTFRAIEFFQLLISKTYLTSTPTLFNSFTQRPQLSSCFLSTVPDCLSGIYDALKDDAMLSKYAGGLGNDWTPVRAMGSHIKGTNGKSQGVVPFLKVANDTAVAVNQCFHPDTPIFTSEGIKDIKDIRIGDRVIGKTGIFRYVLESMTYEQKPEDKMKKITFYHGDVSPTQVTDEHPYYVARHVDLLAENPVNNITFEWVKVGRLLPTDLVGQAIPNETTLTNHLSAADVYIYGLILAAGGVVSGNAPTWYINLSDTDSDTNAIVQQYFTERYIPYTLHNSMGTNHYTWHSSDNFPFVTSQVLNSDNERRLSSDLMHLPIEKTNALVNGIVAATQHVNTERNEQACYLQELTIARQLKYQLLRLGKPAAVIKLDNDLPRYEVCYPDDSLHAQPTFIRIDDFIFTSIESIEDCETSAETHDLIVDVDESYMTIDGLAHNGGKRKGAMCAYLETWHLDIEEFVELRKNVGDDRRRTHDMNTANWIPDVFMKRVLTNGNWTLFSPSDVPDLHDLYGKAFEERYEYYETLAREGKLLSKEVRATDLWRKMLGMLFETGHPWMTFKDPCNLRSPQQHVGVVHSSNLCVAPETLLMTSDGNLPISELIDQEVEFWNGEEWTIGPVVKTGVNQKLLKVVTSENVVLECTEYHKWYIVDEVNSNEWLEVRTIDLSPGDILLNWVTPEGERISGVEIKEIVDEGRFDDTYCCKDPLRSMAMFNGIVTGQCTEITLNTSVEEIAVCNLGSIVLSEFVEDSFLNLPKLRKTIHTAVRMLDNVIDINYYSVNKAAHSNFKHRPIGLGLMGFQDSLYKLGIPYDSDKAIAFADASMEVISYYAIEASMLLAEERGAYETYKGSLWDQGIFPIDSVAAVREARGAEFYTMDQESYLDRFMSDTSMDWIDLRERVKQHGMRNSNVMAIAPTATISNILGVSQSIEPTYQNLYVKSNLSGEFTVINPYLVTELKKYGIWDQEMVDALKVSEGSVQHIDRVPDDVKQLFLTAFEVPPARLIKAAAARQKWIDQAQSLNLYIYGANGRKLDETYKLAWTSGLKTTYYLRALAATTTEKSTVNSSTLNKVQVVASHAPTPPEPLVTGIVDTSIDGFTKAAEVPNACSIDNPDCEACQ